MYHINCVDENNHQTIEKNHQTMEKTAAHADEKNYQIIEETANTAEVLSMVYI